MTSIISVVQTKGGAGKSTLATIVASELAQGASVLLIDADQPQATAASWQALRINHGASDDLSCLTCVSPANLETLLKLNRERYDFIVIDAPPRHSKTISVIVTASNLVLAPLAPVGAEIWAAEDLANLLGETTTSVYFVWNRVRAHLASVQAVMSESKAELSYPTLTTTLGQRLAYSTALSEGLSVTQLKDKKARDETSALITEIKGLL